MAQANGKIYHDQEGEFDDIVHALPPEESEIHQIVKEYINSDNIAGKTDLTEPEVKLFWILGEFDRNYPELNLAEAARAYMHLKISKGAGSRKGLTEILKGRLADFRDDGPMPPGRFRPQGGNGGGF